MENAQIIETLKKGSEVLFPDIAFALAISLEILQFFIKWMVWDKKVFWIRFKSLLMDEPMNLMAIVSGYIGALMISNNNIGNSTFFVFIATLIGLIVISRFNARILEKYDTSSHKRDIVLCSFLLLISYLLPILELLIYVFFLGGKTK